MMKWKEKTLVKMTKRKQTLFILRKQKYIIYADEMGGGNIDDNPM